MATHDLAHPDLGRRLIDVPDHQVPVFEASGWQVVDDGPQRPDDTDPVADWRTYAEAVSVKHKGLSKRQLIKAVDERLAETQSENDPAGEPDTESEEDDES